jgi:hypothetical protein
MTKKPRFFNWSLHSIFLATIPKYSFRLPFGESKTAFVELILGCDAAAELGIDIVYVGVGIASVIVALGIFIHQGMHKKEEEEDGKEDSQ